MDDGSSPPLSEAVPDLGIPRNAVRFEYYPRAYREEHMQYHLYSECHRMFSPLHKWLAFIDGDEFIEMTSGTETLSGFLKSFEEEYDDVGAVAMNWQMHNSNGLASTPERGATRGSFTSCVSDRAEAGERGVGWENSHVKSIVRTEYLDYPITPHFFALKQHKVTRGESGDVVRSSWRKPTRHRIGLHHYAVKSREQFMQKHKLGSANGNFKPLEWIDEIDGRPNITCDSLAVYFP